MYRGRGLGITGGAKRAVGKKDEAGVEGGGFNPCNPRNPRKSAIQTTVQMTWIGAYRWYKGHSGGGRGGR